MKYTIIQILFTKIALKIKIKMCAVHTQQIFMLYFVYIKSIQGCWGQIITSIIYMFVYYLLKIYIVPEKRGRKGNYQGSAAQHINISGGRTATRAIHGRVTYTSESYKTVISRPRAVRKIKSTTNVSGR